MGYQLLKVEEAARKLRIAPSTLYKWRGRKIAYCKLGKSVRFLLADIETFIEENKITPQKEQQQSNIKKIKAAKERMQMSYKNKLRKILRKRGGSIKNG